MRNTKPKIKKEILENLYITEEKTAADIGKILNIRGGKVIYWLHKFDIIVRRTGGKQNFKDLTGMIFGKLTALKYIAPPRPVKNRSAHAWECKCSCGNIKTIARRSLLDGLTKSCGCLRQERRNTFEDISMDYWKRLQAGAKRRNIVFDISIEDAWNVFIKQCKECALTNLNLTLSKRYNIERENQTASLDRIDSNKGYIPENIQWIHKDVNRMKSNLDLNKFLYYCKLISSFQS